MTAARPWPEPGGAVLCLHSSNRPNLHETAHNERALMAYCEHCCPVRWESPCVHTRSIRCIKERNRTEHGTTDTQPAWVGVRVRVRVRVCVDLNPNPGQEEDTSSLRYPVEGTSTGSERGTPTRQGTKHEEEKTNGGEREPTCTCHSVPSKTVTWSKTCAEVAETREGQMENGREI